MSVKGCNNYLLFIFLLGLDCSGSQCCHHRHRGVCKLPGVHDHPGCLPHPSRTPAHHERPGEWQGERDGLGRFSPHHHCQSHGGKTGENVSQAACQSGQRHFLNSKFSCSMNYILSYCVKSRKTSEDLSCNWPFQKEGFFYE